MRRHFIVITVAFITGMLLAWLIAAGQPASAAHGAPALPGARPLYAGAPQVPTSTATPVSQCSTYFSIIASPNAGTGDNSLAGVAAVTSSDVWAVGTYGDSNMVGTLVENWNGSAWNIVASPNPGPVNNALTGIDAVSASDVWAVGSDFTAGSTLVTLVEHWDGAQWSVVPSPNGGTYSNYYHNTLTGVSAVSANDVWAAGDYIDDTTSKYVTLTEHWNGSAWSIVTSPSISNNNNFLYSIAAVSATDAWAVGQINGGSTAQTLIEHWNGSAWSIVPSPDPGPQRNYLQGVSAAAANDVWAVGDYNDAAGVRQTLIEHFDGSAWSVVPSPSPGSYNHLNAVSALSSSNAWALGSFIDGNGAIRSLIETWNGSAWSVLDGPTTVGLDAVSVIGPTGVWAVGGYYTGGPEQTLAEQYIRSCGGTPSPQPSQTPGGPTATPTPTPHVGTAQPTSTSGAGGATATATALSGNFADVPTGSPFYPYVQCLSNRGIISGYACGGPGEPCPGTYFRQQNSITRGQVSKIVANAAGYSDSIPSTQQTFADVPPGSPFWLYVERVAAQGAISGYACGGAGEPCPGTYFRPGNNLTRGQLAKIDANAAGYSDNIPSTQQTFADVPAGSPFWLYVERAATHGVISGYACGGAGEPCPGTYFRPGNLVTRGQTTKIIGNTFFPGCTTLR